MGQAGHFVPIPTFPLASTTMRWLPAVVKLMVLVPLLTTMLLVPDTMRSLLVTSQLAASSSGTARA
jgi:hypothetical protein